MADYSSRLGRMRVRRQGDSETVALASFTESLGYRTRDGASPGLESYQTRSSKTSIQYALGAMQAVDADYTRVSVQEGDRVKAQLREGLQASVEFEYQGSVPLDIHIERHSDIDLLVLLSSIRTYDQSGQRAAQGLYSTPPAKPILTHMVELRADCERVLKSAFPAADVDTEGAKSVSMSGGSLKRKVDVVPAHWHDTASYQQTKQLHDRGVKVLDKKVPETVSNSPFLHMKKVEEKDANSRGGAKKIIRLLKNLKADCDQEISLSSYDIASLVWHFDTASMIQPGNRELTLVSVARTELEAMCRSYAATSTLPTPDGSRKIIDEPGKFSSLQKLQAEIEALAAAVARELEPFSYQGRVKAILEGASIR